MTIRRTRFHAKKIIYPPLSNTLNPVGITACLSRLLEDFKSKAENLDVTYDPECAKLSVLSGRLSDDDYIFTCKALWSPPSFRNIILTDGPLRNNDYQTQTGGIDTFSAEGFTYVLDGIDTHTNQYVYHHGGGTPWNSVWHSDRSSATWIQAPQANNLPWHYGVEIDGERGLQ